MKKNIFTAIFIALKILLGQDISGAFYKNLGPDILPKQNIGFVNTCWTESKDAKIVYAGSLYGGLWKGIKSEVNINSYDWKNITDSYKSPGTGISAIEVVPNSEGRVIYIGTQMGGNGRLYNYSNGILKSVNGGENWEQVGPKINIRDNKIVDYLKMNPEYPDVMYARIGSENYFTEDAWKTWRKIYPPFKNKDQFFHIADCEWKPGDPKTFYISSRSENNEKAEFYCSKDGCKSWLDLKHDLFASNIQIDVIRKKGFENLIYIAHAEQGAFIQIYDGNKWSENRNKNGVFIGNGYWNMEFDVNEEDTSVMYLSMTQVAKSKNGGLTFQTISDYYGANTHADVRDLKIINASVQGKDDIVMMANDGGISVSLPGAENAKTWTNINGKGLSIAQLWGIGSSESLNDYVVGGGQDNGIYTLRNGEWSNQTSGVGDGYDAAISELNTEYAIAQGNSPTLVLTSNGGKNWRGNPTPPGPCSNFRRPMWMDKKNNRLWLGHHQLFCKDNSNGKLDAKWEQKTFFPDMKQNNGMLFNQQINCFAMNGIKKEKCLLIFSGVLWAKDSLKGKIFFTSNLNEAEPIWRDLTRFAPRVNWREIADIVADPNDDNIYYAIWQDIYSGFKSEIMKMEISENPDTIIFTDITYNLPDHPANKICVEESSAGNIYLGTDTGIYFTNYKMMEAGKWVRFENEKSKLPFTVISDLEINQSSNTLYVATYGRGLWSTPLAETGNEKNIYIKKNTTWNSTRKIDGKLTVAKGKTLTIEKDIFVTSKAKIELRKNSRIILNEGVKIRNNERETYNNGKIKIGKGSSISFR
jgi:hypothetical protein